MNIIKASTGMWLKPNHETSLETECLFGETIKIITEHSKWCFCELVTDNYKGWVKKSSLGVFKPPTHRVLSIRSLIFKDKDIKSHFIDYLPLGSKISVVDICDNWAKIILSNKHKFKYGYVPIKHIVEINNKVLDWVKIAEQLIDTPYKWGGRDTIGIDCSALLQLSYETYGEKIPRNSSDQINLEKELITNPYILFRGLVVFWDKHVGIMVDRFNCIHANAFHMKTVVEPLEKINKRMGGENKILKIMNFN